MTTPRNPANAGARKGKATAAASMAKDKPALSLVDRQRAVRRRSLEQKNPPAAAMPQPPAAVPVAVPAPAHPAYAEANARALEFTKIAAFASKHGVNFDMAAAMGSTMTAQYARNLVIDQMAAADEAMPTICTPTNVSAAAASDKSQWDAANAKVAKRLGFGAPK